MDIARPYEGAVFLAAGPGAADEVDRVPLPRGDHAVVEGLRVHGGVDVPDLEVRAEVIPVVVEVVDRVLGFRLVEPEKAYAPVVVTLLDRSPEILPRSRIGRVVEERVAAELHGDAHSTIDADEIALAQHLLVMGASRLDGGPYRDHELDSHGIKLADHGLGIGPVGGVEVPIALLYPVEEVDDDDGDGQSPALVLARRLEELPLRPVSQLALPEAHAVVGHHRNLARRFRVRLLDLGGRIPRGNPVVEGLRRVSLPLGEVFPEDDLADGRVVPQEAVASAREREGYAHLRVAVRELKAAALHVHVGLLVLTHAEYLLVGIGLEAHREPVIATRHGRKLAGHHLYRAGRPGAVPVARVLLKEDPAFPIEERDPPVARDLGPYLSVRDRRGFPSNLDDGGAALPREEGPVGIGHLGQLRRAHAEAVLAPGLYTERLGIEPADEALPVDTKNAFHAHLLYVRTRRAQ